MFSCCICCKRNKSQKNELLGLEGKVKMKNPDDHQNDVTKMGPSESYQADLNISLSNADSDKRASTAAHRSLPDIPIADGDTGSELYETVADKHLLEQQNSQDRNSPAASLKKQTSVSQHSSISQADDFSSPYSRVKNNPHGYAKVRSTEHPYAQVNPPHNLNASAANANASGSNANITVLNNSRTGASSRCSQHQNGSTQDLNESNTSQVEIPAASAIAGMISASQDLPYMTPPIATQHFSGDSQDSSKGYTSISVREPLANILAQQPATKPPLQRNAIVERDVNDSHYATVSDDSDETYAAIEDPNLRNNPNLATDIYTSGSETYAQIQPMQSFVVSVEINNASEHAATEVESNNNNNHINIANSSSNHLNAHANPQMHQHLTPIPPAVDSLRTAGQMHARQASSSSNHSSSVGNLGSPKPEKRQANSPLPPTPKSSSASNQNSSNQTTSGRNSVISVVDLTNTSGSSANQTEDCNNPQMASNENSPLKKANKSLSPSKDIENMYAKVMKKNKFSTRNSPPSNNNSPIMTRKYNNDTSTDVKSSLGISPLDSSAADILDSRKIVISTPSSTTLMVGNENRTRSNSYGNSNDHGYETIPADVNRKSDGCYAHILKKERQLEGNAAPSSLSTGALNTSIKVPAIEPEQLQADAKVINASYVRAEKHYETIPGAGDNFEHSTSSDPGYETLLKPNRSQAEADLEKRSDYDPNYEVLRGPSNPNSAGLSDDGYAKVVEKQPSTVEDDSIDGYSKVKGEENEDGYSTIREFKDSSANAHLRADDNHNYASISEAKGISLEPSSKSQQNLSSHVTAISAAFTPVRVLGESISVDSLRQKTLPSELTTLASPSSYNSNSLLNNSSATSTTNITTTSTRSTLSSSRQTPSSSQYESFTGSDTDPNYESVNYLHSKTLTRSSSDDVNHPYERLATTTTSELLSSLTSSPIADRNRPTSSSSTSLETPMQFARATTVTVGSITTIKTGNGASVQQTVISSSEAVVDDYFQV